MDATNPPQAGPTSHRAPAAVSAISRRRVLASGAAVIAGMCGGVGYEWLVGKRTDAPGRKAPPQSLIAALAAERMLIADLDAAVARDGSLRGAVAGIRSDHAAHEAALRAAVSAYDSTLAQPSPTSPATSGSLTRVQLRRAELAASAHAATNAQALIGRDAALLASIAASEATHAELLG